MLLRRLTLHSQSSLLHPGCLRLAPTDERRSCHSILAYTPCPEQNRLIPSSYSIRVLATGSSGQQ